MTLNGIVQSPCLWLGDHLEYCKPPTHVEEASDLWSWIPENSEWVYLIKITGFTLAYLPSTDTVYFTHSAFQLKSSCPSMSIFMCQSFSDFDCPPRLFVMDLLCDKGVSTKDVQPVERYRRLQELQQHFAEPNVVLQWCGDHDAISKEFLSTLPHNTIARVGLGVNAGCIFVEKCN
jgi:hypothetical protein